jgi:hypothetical protein
MRARAQSLSRSPVGRSASVLGRPDRTPAIACQSERRSSAERSDTSGISRLFRVGRLANIRPVGSDRVLRGRGSAARGSHDITKQGPSANSEACGGCVDPCGRVITTLLSEPRVRNGP